MARGDLSGSIDCIEDLTQAAEAAGDEYGAALPRLVAYRFARRVPV